MSSLRDTYWHRKSDGASFQVIADSDNSGFAQRSIRMKNQSTGREHWATVDGLARKYERCTQDCFKLG